MKFYKIVLIIFFLFSPIIFSYAQDNQETPPPIPRYQQDPKHTKGPILGEKKEQEVIDVLKDYNPESKEWFTQSITFEKEGKEFLSQYEEQVRDRGGKPFFKGKAFSTKDQTQKSRMNRIACALLYTNIKVEYFHYDVLPSHARIDEFRRSEQERLALLHEAYKKGEPIKQEFDQFITDCLSFF